MSPDYIAIGDTVADSPVGPGKVTDITDAGYPQVNGVAVARLTRTDGVVFDPYGSYARDKVKADAAREGRETAPAPKESDHA